MDLLEVAPAFVCSKFEGFTFRGTDLLALVGNQSGGCLAACALYREVVPIAESPFREFPL